MNDVHSGSKAGSLKAITVRLEPGDYERLRAYADARQESLNVIVNEAIAEYGCKIEREEVLRRIDAFRSSLKISQDPKDDAVAILRDLRRERSSGGPGEDR